MITACTPTFDWRSVKLNSHGDVYALTFPGKPVQAEKKVMLLEQQHPLRLYGVQTGEAQFALGMVAATDASHAKALAQALAAAFADNLNASNSNSNTGSEIKTSSKAPSNHQQAVALKHTAGAFNVTYALPLQSGRYAQARFVWTQHAAYELLAVGKMGEFNAEVADNFIRSLQFEP